MSPGRIERIAKTYLPESVRLPLRYLKLRIAQRARDFRDLRQREHWKGVPLPDSRLRYRVQGAVSEIMPFMIAGLNCAQNIRSALGRQDRRIAEFDRILDWGCGCGRVLRWFKGDAAPGRFTGVDIDGQAIDWCRRNLPWAEFHQNQNLPPLPLDKEALDLVLGLSVLNHMDLSYQEQWLDEIARVLRPGGMAAITFFGSIAQKHLLKEAERKRLDGDGFLFKVGVTGRFKPDNLPDFFQLAFQTRSRALSLCSGRFKVLDYIEGGLANFEDLVVLEKPGSS